MIVVAIVGILAAIAIPNFLRYRGQAMQAEARSNLGAILVGEMSFFTERKDLEILQILALHQSKGDEPVHLSNRLSVGGRLGPNGGNLCGLPSTATRFKREAPTAALVTFTGLVGIATTSVSGFTATAAADLDGDATHDGWYVNDAKQGLSSAEPNDVSS